GHTDRLVSPPLNLSGYLNAHLSFRYAYAAYQAGYSDSLRVYVSNDCGLSWTRIFNEGEDGSGNFATRPPLTTQFIPTAASDWCGDATGPACISLDLGPWLGSPNVIIAFESYSYLSNNLFIDDVVVDPVGGFDDKDMLSGIEVWPNPARERFSFVSPFQGDVLLRLTDVTGRIVWQEERRVTKGASDEVIPGIETPGIYLFSMRSESKTVSVRLSIQ
ncbi:MAG: T9SS type A sorting domain-containing protein, partial [Bacteroidales bacterium]|nr:T9SS type A sorting domain-containing protein [Bacteroidales bacterium]